jgi:hypothetical protein
MRGKSPLFIFFLFWALCFAEENVVVRGIGSTLAAPLFSQLWGISFQFIYPSLLDQLLSHFLILRWISFTKHWDQGKEKQGLRMTRMFITSVQPTIPSPKANSRR